MAARFVAFVPRMAVIGLVWLFATGTLTFAAERKLSTPAKAPAPAVAAARPILVVPDIRGQAFVFGKGILEDGGFGWRVSGAVRGYATNVVATQQPAAGTRVVDTGAPALTLTLRRGTYAQNGMPEDTSPYAGTAIVLDKPALPAKKPVAVTPAKLVAKPAKKTVRATAKPKHKLAQPKQRVAHPKHKVASAKPRPTAFAVPGAPKEPLNEIPLTARADKLEAWLAQARQPTTSNVRHWLYQQAWIVTGARFGWWHGAQALRTLIRVDKRVEARWGIGHRSELVARNALAAVEARGR
jgi:hypothetical protein